MLESFAEGAEEPGDALQMFKRGTPHTQRRSLAGDGEVPVGIAGQGWMEVGSGQIQRPGLKSEGQRRARVGMGWHVRIRTSNTTEKSQSRSCTQKGDAAKGASQKNILGRDILEVKGYSLTRDESLGTNSKHILPKSLVPGITC